MELIVYSSAWCPDCREAKRFLAKHNIPYQEIDVATTPGAIEEIVTVELPTTRPKTVRSESVLHRIAWSFFIAVP